VARVAFFVLLFVNLVFMAWAGWVDTPRQARTTDANARLPKLKLVSETPSASQQGNPQTGGAVRKMAMTTPPGGTSGAAPAVATRCVSLGPFNDIATAAKAAGSLQARGFASQQRAAAGEVWDGYWVYIGGVADVATADKIFKTLDRSGIKDAHLMPDTSDTHRMSVGLFSERDRAERRAKAIQKLGFKAEVDDHRQSGTVYWVDLVMKPSDQAVPVEDLLSADSGNSHLSVEACPPGAGVQHAASPQAAPAQPVPAAPTTVAGTPKLP
jgi:cell division septation protein DedD